MPERLREEFALPYDEREERTTARARRWLPHAYRMLPASFRYVGPYHEARSRLQNRGIGLLTHEYPILDGTIENAISKSRFHGPALGPAARRCSLVYEAEPITPGLLFDVEVSGDDRYAVVRAIIASVF
jgi:hypothetical protein